MLMDIFKKLGTRLAHTPMCDSPIRDIVLYTHTFLVSLAPGFFDLLVSVDLFSVFNFAYLHMNFIILSLLQMGHMLGFPKGTFIDLTDTDFVVLKKSKELC